MNPSSRHRLVVATLVLIVSGFFVQCYTTLRHPEVTAPRENSEFVHNGEVTFMDDCSSCHDQSATVAEPYQELYYSTDYEQDYNWEYYFVLPWWIDEYYYYESLPAAGNDPVHPPERRGFERGEIGGTPSYSTPNMSQPALSKTPTTESNPSEPAKRHERRDSATDQNKESTKSTTPEPVREKKEKKSDKNIK